MSAAVNLAWRVVHDAVEQKLEDKRKLLETCEPQDLLRIQGEVAALLFVLALPDTLAKDPAKMIGDDVPYT